MKYFVKSRLSENIAETPEGFLLCLAVPIARTGDMEYGEGETPLETDGNGKIIISRDEKEVFRPETIASFEGKPVTITHPVDFVDPNNWSRLAKGTMQNVRRGAGEHSDDLLADLLITDNMAIQLVKSGLREVSCGYEAEYNQTGEGRGTQSKIIGNHLALVEQGRAGSTYAINDHKAKGAKMKIKDKIKAIFAKAQDEAMKCAEDAESSAASAQGEKVEHGAYDELVEMVKDLGEKVSAMGKQQKDEAAPSKSKEDKAEPKEKKKDEGADEDVNSALEDRLKAIEAAVAKLMERESKEDEVSMDEDMDGDESEDDDFEESTMVGDTASRAEILAPGIKITKDVKVKALKAASETKDGAKVIKQLTGDKAPDYNSEVAVNALFIAASELLKVSRSKDLSRTKTGDNAGDSVTSQEPMSAEKLNEINAKFYNRN